VTYTGLMTTRYLFRLRNRVLRDRDRDDQPARGRAAVPGQSGQRPGLSGLRAKDRPDGNESPACACPTFRCRSHTYTGWALRAGPQANDGCEAAGQFIPFPRTEAERAASGDPRRSLESRYKTFEVYHRKVVDAIERMVEDRLMLCEDVDDEVTRLDPARCRSGRAAARGRGGAARRAAAPMPQA